VSWKEEERWFIEICFSNHELGEALLCGKTVLGVHDKETHILDDCFWFFVEEPPKWYVAEWALYKLKGGKEHFVRSRWYDEWVKRRRENERGFIWVCD